MLYLLCKSSTFVWFLKAMHVEIIFAKQYLDWLHCRQVSPCRKMSSKYRWCSLSNLFLQSISFVLAVHNVQCILWPQLWEDNNVSQNVQHNHAKECSIHLLGSELYPSCQGKVSVESCWNFAQVLPTLQHSDHFLVQILANIINICPEIDLLAHQCNACCNRLDCDHSTNLPSGKLLSSMSCGYSHCIALFPFYQVICCIDNNMHHSDRV